jgi:uncharacterized protein YbjT (DUF2867 family)
MTITVTGATGLIGAELVRLLSESGRPVRAVTRDAGRGTSRPGVAWVQADLRDARLLEPTLAGTTGLFLLTDNQRGFGELQAAVLRAVRDAGVRHVVKVSALGASDHSRSWIGLEHWHVEQVLKEPSDMTWTILRPHAFMQNWLGEVAGTVRAEGRIYSPIEDGRVPFIDARDIAAVAAAVLLRPEDHAGATYVLTGGAAVGYADVADALTEATARPVVYQPISMDDAAARMRADGVNEESIQAMLALARYQRAGGPTAQVSEDVRWILGRDPLTVRDFARDHRDHFLPDSSTATG